MKLYHGTSSRLLPKIHKEGLTPRTVSKRKTNWKANPSHPNAVYLTNAYAGFYANAACKGNDKWAVLEIDCDQLCPWAFAPDEDFLEQVGRGKDGVTGDMYQRTVTLKKQLHKFKGDLESHAVALSLKHLGNCTYHGNIPPDAITRVALIDPKAAQEYVFRVFDPSIVLLNYKICGASYRNSIKWLFGEPLEEDMVQTFKPPTTRDGILVTDWPF